MVGESLFSKGSLNDSVNGVRNWGDTQPTANGIATSINTKSEEGVFMMKLSVRAEGSGCIFKPPLVKRVLVELVGRMIACLVVKKSYFVARCQETSLAIVDGILVFWAFDRLDKAGGCLPYLSCKWFTCYRCVEYSEEKFSGGNETGGCSGTSPYLISVCMVSETVGGAVLGVMIRNGFGDC